MSEKKYPFNEGDRYFTIDGNTIVESVWDEQSEELYETDTLYFVTLIEALNYYKYKKALSFMVKAMSFIESRKPSARRTEMIEEFQKFNPIPNLSRL